MEFAKWARRVNHEAGHEYSPDRGFSRSVCVVATGVAMLARVLEDGRRHIAGFRFPGEPIALNGMLPTNFSIIALTPLSVCRIDGDQADRFFARHPQAGKSLVELAGQLMTGMADHMVLLGRMDASERICAFLADCAARFGIKEDGELHLTLPMNRNQIADNLGINPETVSRQMTRLKEAGLIKMPAPTQVVIRDLAALRRRVPAISQD